MRLRSHLFRNDDDFSSEEEEVEEDRRSRRLVRNSKWSFHSLYDPGSSATERSPTMIRALTTFLISSRNADGECVMPGAGADEIRNVRPAALTVVVRAR